MHGTLFIEKIITTQSFLFTISPKQIDNLQCSRLKKIVLKKHLLYRDVLCNFLI
jgi:hypothetical protein